MGRVAQEHETLVIGHRVCEGEWPVGLGGTPRDAARRPADEPGGERETHLIDEAGIEQGSEQMRAALAQDLRHPRWAKASSIAARSTSLAAVDHVGHGLSASRATPARASS